MMAVMDYALVLRTPGRSAQLLVGEPTLPYEDNDFRVVKMRLVDEGVTAEADVQLSIVDDPPLGTFLMQLADGWRGWDGIRTWRAAERQLVLDARHDGRGKVKLGVTLKSWRATQSADVWSARTVFTLEAGEQMRRLADDVTMLLGW
jgi:Family of unknown function (DUF6228)